MTRRWIFLVCAIACVPLGLIAKTVPPGPLHWVSSSLAGAIYVMWWSFLALSIFPRVSVRRVIGIVTVATCIIELMQLWHPTFLETARATTPGALVLGSTFSWVDFPFYFLGAFVAWAVAVKLSK